ncbi:MAG: carboxypeptidase regulatory-like domain-containing protein [Candidatus Aminicenantes bacterium]|nr:MAG: carboxypeptidase regulatory-like domain-containing protein [Candidatus Aminicenantes bacterium]
MKKNIFLIVLFIGICSSEILLSLDQYEDDPLLNRDSFGKVIGQIIDPETGKPVNERFLVCIFNWHYREGDYERYKDCNFKTDEKGWITLNLPPATYGLLFYPQNPDSKYSGTYHPFYYKMPEEYKEIFSCVIKVETGQITRFVRKAIIGGALKVTLVDLAGNPVDPAVAFPGRSVATEGGIDNYNLSPGSASLSLTLENGKFFRKNLFPDTSWEMDLRFYGIGYGVFRKKDIVIKANEVTEINITIDPNDITGVEGKIIDELGIPQKKVRISFFPKDESIEGDFDYYTDSTGHYIMTGMPEGFYEVEIFDGHEYYFTFQNIIIEIKKNILLKRDFTIPTSEN